MESFTIKTARENSATKFSGKLGLLVGGVVGSVLDVFWSRNLSVGAACEVGFAGGAGGACGRGACGC